MTLTGVAQSRWLVPNLVVSVSVEGDATVVGPRGEADIATLAVIDAALARVIADHQGAVVVDLAHTEFIDTATVRALCRAQQALADRGRQLTFRSPSRLAVRLLASFGLTHLVQPGGTVER